MPTTFDVIYLGNFASLDPNEGNQYLNQSAVNGLLGTYGSAGNGLTNAANIRELSPNAGGFSGGQIDNAYDLNNNAANEGYTIDGVAQTHDATMQYNAVITYPDGSTANITAVIMQSTNGDVYLAPETTNNADQMALSAGPIQSLELVSPIYAQGNTGQGYNLFGDRFAEGFVPCFTPGAMIATPKGEVAVEKLRAGDRVFTRDNGIQEIVWVGGRDLSAADLAQNAAFQPVMVRAGALGPNLPETDMVLSPNHRILIIGRDNELYFEENEVLVAAKHLVHMDGVDVVQAAAGVQYIHMMFARHQVVLCNGAWSESFQPGDYALKGIGKAQRKELIDLFPELATIDGINGYEAARTSLRRHEAKLIF